MNGDDRMSVASRQVLGDGTPPVAAMGAKKRVAQLLDHELVPKAGEAKSPPFVRTRLGEPVSWQAWNYDAERVNRVAAVRARMVRAR
jgi:hypothetical protein